MTALVAITREVTPAIARCELTHLSRVRIDVERARTQHARYEDVLASLGCAVERLPSPPHLPDAVFVEDTAVVLDEISIVTRPGPESRRAEIPLVEHALTRHREVARIEPPGTLDGGDVLRVGRSIFVGRSSRTNDAAIAQLRAIVEPFGYELEPVDVRECLHLKSAVTAVDDHVLLMNRAWLPVQALERFDSVEVDPFEPYAANALRVGESIVYAAAFPRTRGRLQALGLAVVEVDLSELAKAEGAVTCGSLVLEARKSSSPVEESDTMRPTS